MGLASEVILVDDYGKDDSSGDRDEQCGDPGICNLYDWKVSA